MRNDLKEDKSVVGGTVVKVADIRQGFGNWFRKAGTGRINGRICHIGREVRRGKDLKYSVQSPMGNKGKQR
jgi:hypothetical protein